MPCMTNDKRNQSENTEGQSQRLSLQHEDAGGPRGTFSGPAWEHDQSIAKVMESVAKELKNEYPHVLFRHRWSIPKREINDRLAAIDTRLGQVLYVRNAEIKPDGGIIEVRDRSGQYRVVLASEAKHQGNDIEKIRAGIKQGKNKDQDLMVAGNAIERVHKNIQEIRNLMLAESHFPYVIFLQGSNFATSTFYVDTPDKRRVKIAHDAGNLNRIDRVTASNFGMEINRNHCRNIFIEVNSQQYMLQSPSLYFQSGKWSAQDMANILWDIAETSMSVLSDTLPKRDQH